MTLTSADEDYWLDMWRRERAKNESADADRLLAKVKKLRLKRGDTVVIEAPHEITERMVNRIKDHFDKAFKKLDVKAIVLADGMKIAKVIPKKK